MKARIFTLIFLFLSYSVLAREDVPNGSGKGNTNNSTLVTGCSPTTAKTDLDINNIRTTIMVGGDMWWDLNLPKYEVPRGSGKHSLFAGALWIGGRDAGNQLKIAAQTYRQGPNFQGGWDFWGGPINQDLIDVSSSTCSDYDRHWKLNRQEVADFITNYVENGNTAVAGYIVPEAIRTWPGNGNPANNETTRLAPFFDQNGDDVYDYTQGDYPLYDFNDSLSCTACGNPDYVDILYGHQTIWWVFNDVGNAHTETDGASIGLEVQAQAFAFTSNNEVNSMTFYKYKIINRGTTTLFDTYFGQWVDPDLGNYIDDYVGCDVGRGLGYCYNGDADDDGVTGYGLNPPAIGVDFFQGPLADPNDGIDNNRNGVVDEPCEEIIMSKFVYYDNNATVTGNPENAGDFYDYLRGIWKDGTPITYGGNGYGGTILADFMFPGNTDPTGWGTGLPQPAWTEASAGNLPGDRRFLQSAGTFTLTPGAVNYITTGVVWAKANSGGPQASIALIQGASDKAQALFDNCFQVISGPPAPNLVIRELDKKLILSLVNTQPAESFDRIDPAIPATYPDSLRRYTFEGYQIFQLKDRNVSIEEVRRLDPDRVRLVAQVDINNDIGQLVNWTFDPEINASVPQEMVSREGTNEGIRHTFVITQDEFALGDKQLVNHKTYYYTVLAYAVNEYKPYTPGDPDPGQLEPYIASSNTRKYSAIPHKPVVSNFGQLFNAEYGSGMPITRIEGQGNGGNIMALVPGQDDEIFTNPNHRIDHPTYYGNRAGMEQSRGPVNVFVYDPVNVKPADFELRFEGMSDSSHWTLRNLTTQEMFISDFPWQMDYEQLILKWGLSINIGKVAEPGPGAINNGYLGAEKTFADPSRPWLSGVADVEGESPANWIRSGTAGAPLDFAGIDDQQVYEGVLGGTWAPHRLVSKDPPAGPKWSGTVDAQNTLDKVVSVEVVFTPDKNKWTRSSVIDAIYTSGMILANKYNLRSSPSIDKDGNNDGSGTTGLGWFPGYAINLENGERLNIIYAENSFYTGSNGADMLWNPDGIVLDSGEPIFGGQHYIYIMNTKYDESQYYHAQLLPGTPTGKRNTFKDAIWVSIPIVPDGQQLLSTEARVRLNIANTYRTYAVNGENNAMPMYRFSTSGLEATQNNIEVARTALDEIRVVPNPYYAYSEYERNQLDNRVKITNLPPTCTVSIYTVNGTLIRRYNRNIPFTDTNYGEFAEFENPDSSIDWDLRNSRNVPVASGLYIIHVNVPGVGEKIVKFMGVMRPVDLDTF
ncbi:MAG: hypothetical protein ACR2GN_00775 [Bacteroidia bacterium]